ALTRCASAPGLFEAAASFPRERVSARSAAPSTPVGLELSGQDIETIKGSDMSKRQGPKYKIHRRLNCNLWGRAKSPINKREYGPGQHAQRRKKPSEYGLQLMAKQKLKGYYGNMGERPIPALVLQAPATHRGAAA